MAFQPIVSFTSLICLLLNASPTFPIAEVINAVKHEMGKHLEIVSIPPETAKRDDVARRGANFRKGSVFSDLTLVLKRDERRGGNIEF